MYIHKKIIMYIEGAVFISSYLYVESMQKIRSLINENNIANGEKLPSFNELADTFGVSLITIRRAIKNMVSANELISRRGSGVFVAGSPSAPRLKAMGNICILMPFGNNAFGQAQILSGAVEELQNHGYKVSIKDISFTGCKEREVLSQTVDEDPEGIIYFPMHIDFVQDLLVILEAEKKSIVLVDKESMEFNLPFVVSANYNGGYLATNHLLKKGHRHIAFVSPWGINEACSVRNRFAGYCAALKEAGQKIEKSMIVPDYVNLFKQSRPIADKYTQENEEKDLEKMVERLRSSGATAVFSVNDEVAYMILAAARRINIKIPEDMSVVGFDNLDASAHLECPLTTIAQDFRAIGVKAAGILESIVSKKPNVPMRNLVPVKLVERHTVIQV